MPAADPRDQPLVDDAGQRGGELHADLRLLVGRGRRRSMRASDCAVSLVCRVAKTRWPVSAMVSANRIDSRSRISPTSRTSGSSRSAERSASGNDGGVGADLALVDRRALVVVHVLDRVLDGEDVAGPLGVDLVDHRGERGRLARAGRPGDQDQALVQAGELARAPAAGRARPCVGMRRGIIRSASAVLVPLAERVAADAGRRRARRRRSRSSCRPAKAPTGRRRASSATQRLGVLGGERRGVGHGRSSPWTRSCGRQADRQQQVGAAGLPERVEQPVDDTAADWS